MAAAEPIAQRARSGPAGATASIAGVRQTVVIGYSRQHRPITAYQVGNPAAPFTAVVLGSMHGYHERAGEQVVAALKAMAIPANANLWLVPTMNPDGDALRQRGNANLVDLNRNWPNRWQYIAGNPADRFDSHYSGPAALSEPETRAMQAFLLRVKPGRVVSMHQPLDGVDTTDGGAKDPAFRNALAANLGLPRKALTCFGGCHGSMTGWLTNYTRTVAITVEFGSAPSSSYLSGQAARGVLSALLLGIPPAAPSVVGAAAFGVSGSTGLHIAGWTGALITGWTFDPQRSSSANAVTVTANGRAAARVVAKGLSPAVNTRYHISGGHGYTAKVPLAPGRYTICVTASAAPGSSSFAKSLGCRSVAIPKLPPMRGHVDSIRTTASGVRVVGWILDPCHPGAWEYVALQIDSRQVALLNTSILRDDVNRAQHTTGRHGFDVTLALRPGRYQLTVIAATTAPGCRAAVVVSRAIAIS